MPIEKESKHKLWKMDNALRQAFDEKVLPLLRRLLAKKGYQALEYLNGIIDKETSDKVIEIVFTPNVCGKHKELESMDIILMEVGGTAVPDIVVHKKGTKRKSKKYPVLIEQSSRMIEVYDPEIYDEVMTFAQNWEHVLSHNFNLKEVDVCIIICFG